MFEIKVKKKAKCLEKTFKNKTFQYLMPHLFSYGLLNIPTVFEDETIKSMKSKETSLDLNLLDFGHHLNISESHQFD